MENLKIKVNSEAESKEAQELFFELGGTWGHCGNNLANLDAKYFHTDCMEVTCTDDYEIFIEWDGKEITLPELRAMASTEKEYINKTTGEYRKTSEVVSVEQWVEVPNPDCIFAVIDGSGSITFSSIVKSLGYLMSSLTNARLLWTRAAKPESLPFVDDEPRGLNDQYSEIEQVRQATKDNVNHPSHYTQGKVECIDALESATIGKSGIEAVCVANVIKYLWRYEEKNGVEDVKKAQFYLNRLLATLENNNG